MTDPLIVAADVVKGYQTPAAYVPVLRDLGRFLLERVDAVR